MIFLLSDWNPRSEEIDTPILNVYGHACPDMLKYGLIP